VVVWLYAGEAQLISPDARALLASRALWVSPMVALELRPLVTKDRTILEHCPLAVW
jgi:hypothetical protein